jgi:predicted nucleotidyltransferase
MLEGVTSRGLPRHLSPIEAAAIAELVGSARAVLGADLHEVRLYGSRARGEGDEESDLDLAFIVTPRGRARRREIYDLAYDIGLRLGVDLAPMLIERERLDTLRARERLFAAELDRDGVVL